MNTNSKVVDEVFTDIETGMFDKASAILSENFKSNILGREVNKSVYLSTYRSLLKGIPDLKFKVEAVKTEDGMVTAKLRVTGTNSQPIPALMNGWHQIPATHKKVDGLVTDLEIRLRNDKIEEIRNAKNGKGLFLSLFDNLGVDYKKMQQN
jgi:predicted ester cyclase